jgi:hypothetical protein
MTDHFRTLVIASLGALILIGILFWGDPRTIPNCFPIPTAANQEGTQGYRLWSGESLKSFDTGGKRICIPPGWQPVGEISSGPGFAEFPPNLTGVIIKTDSFASTTITLTNSSYNVTVLYPIATPPALVPAYAALVTHAFNTVGKLFADSSSISPTRPHTVLITAGLAGDTRGDGTRVYPDPGPNATMLVRSLDQPRSGELFIHAITHLYNRERPDLDAYENNQSPLKASDWQELEATWSETAFTESEALRLLRVQYLYQVHTAVETQNFSLISGPPFNDAVAFKRIKKSVAVPEDASYLDEQYGHYILAPLVLIATEGLLIQNHTGTSVEKILTDLHTGKSTSFFDALAAVLPKEKVTEVTQWMQGEKTIPQELVLVGAKSY